MTMPASPLGDLVAHLPLLLRRHRSGQQRDPRRAVGAAELTRHRQRPEDVADRPGMLGGKDFRRRQQRALVARRRPSAASPAPRRWSCPSRPRPAACGSSAGWPPVRPTARRALPAGRRSIRTATARSMRGQQSVVFRRGDGTGLAQFAVTAPHQRPLQPDGLVEREARAGALAFGRVLGEVDRPQRLVFGRSDCVAAETIPAAAPRPGRARRAPGAHRRRCPSSAPSRWPGRSGRSPARTPPAGRRRWLPTLRRSSCSDLVPIVSAARRFEHEERRMRQLHRALEVADLARTASPACPRSSSS